MPARLTVVSVAPNPAAALRSRAVRPRRLTLTAFFVLGALGAPGCKKGARPSGAAHQRFLQPRPPLAPVPVDIPEVGERRRQAHTKIGVRNEECGFGIGNGTSTEIVSGNVAKRTSGMTKRRMR